MHTALTGHKKEEELVRPVPYVLLWIVLLFSWSFVPFPAGFEVSSVLAETGERSAPQAPAGKEGGAAWKISYWFWPGWSWGNNDIPEKKPERVDSIYVLVGEYGRSEDPVDERWPDFMPTAQAYVVVFRCDGSSCMREGRAAELVKNYAALKETGVWKRYNVKGIQIDYDCPTRSLVEYGRFLKKLKEGIPKGDILSVTALLDWFRPGTAVSEVLREVDEFVPQFYDVDLKKAGEAKGGIAEPVDAARWAPVFNQYGTPYRIGIASFGRLLEIGKSRSRALSAKETVSISGDTAPLGALSEKKGAFVGSGESRAGEALAYLIEKPGGGSGETTKLIIPTRKSVLSAYEGARKMGSLCRGVIFFRYPVGNEPMMLFPSEVSRIIAGGDRTLKETRVEADDGDCAAVSCNDLYIVPKDRFLDKATVLSIRSSGDMDYFISDEVVETRARGPRLIEVTIPAYAGSFRISVGRAVSREPVTFTVEEKP